MKLFRPSYSIYEISVSSSTRLFLLAKEQDLTILKVDKVDTYVYFIEVPFAERKKVKKSFKDARFRKNVGFLAMFSSLLIKKTTLVALVVGICFFFYLHTLLIGIEVRGSNQKMNQSIRAFLEEKSIRVYQKMPSIEELKKAKDQFFFDHMDSIETIEFVARGSYLFISYTTKRNEVYQEERKGKIYAKKDAMIASYHISSGNLLIKPNQYVKQNDLLIDDTFYYKDTAIFVGTMGIVYGYTWQSITIETPRYSMEESEALTYLLDKARHQVGQDFEEGEYIDVEKIMQFRLFEDTMLLKVHYTVFENIVSYQIQ